MEDVTMAEYLVGFLGVVVTVLVGWAFTAVNSYLKSKGIAEIDEGFKGYILEAVAYGERVAAKTLDRQADRISFEREAVNQAVQFLYLEAPKWIKMLGFTREALEKRLLAYLKD